MTSLLKPTKPGQPSGPAPTKVFGITISGGNRSGKPGKPGGAGTSLVVGGEPRIHLLPPEVNQRKRGKEMRRRLGLGVIGVVILVGAGMGLATLSQISAQGQLATTQSQSASLLQQQAKYSEVTKVQSDQASILSSQKIATSQEIAWKPYVAAIEASLPAGAALTGFTGTIDSPFLVAVAPTDPLQGPRIATITTTTAMQEPTVAAWLNTLPKLKGFVDATPDSVTLSQTKTFYLVVVTIHVNDKALLNRYTKTAKTAGTTK